MKKFSDTPKPNPRNPNTTMARKRARKTKEYRNWLDLPKDVTVSILQRLGAIDILESAQKVCMLWRNICKDPSMWRAIDMQNLGDLHDMPYDLEKMCIHAIDRSCGQLRDINIEYFGTDELLIYITQSTSQLRRLRLVCCYDITDKKLSELAAKLPLLEELDMTISSLSEEPLGAFGRCCPLLKSLKWNQLWDGRPHIRIEGDEEFDDDGVALAIAKNMPELRHLQLIGNKVTNDGLQAILDGCPHLESLDIRKCFNVTLSGNLGKRCAERIKNLRHPNDSTHDYGFMAEISDMDHFDEDDSGDFYFDY